MKKMKKHVSFNFFILFQTRFEKNGFFTDPYIFQFIFTIQRWSYSKLFSQYKADHIPIYFPIIQIYFPNSNLFSQYKPDHIRLWDPNFHLWRKFHSRLMPFQMLQQIIQLFHYFYHYYIIILLEQIIQLFMLLFLYNKYSYVIILSELSTDVYLLQFVFPSDVWMHYRLWGV